MSTDKTKTESLVKGAQNKRRTSSLNSLAGLVSDGNKVKLVNADALATQLLARTSSIVSLAHVQKLGSHAVVQTVQSLSTVTPQDRAMTLSILESNLQKMEKKEDNAVPAVQSASAGKSNASAEYEDDEDEDEDEDSEEIEENSIANGEKSIFLKPSNADQIKADLEQAPAANHSERNESMKTSRPLEKNRTSDWSIWQSPVLTIELKVDPSILEPEPSAGDLSKLPEDFIHRKIKSRLSRNNGNLLPPAPGDGTSITTYQKKPPPLPKDDKASKQGSGDRILNLGSAITIQDSTAPIQGNATTNQGSAASNQGSTASNQGGAVSNQAGTAPNQSSTTGSQGNTPTKNKPKPPPLPSKQQIQPLSPQQDAQQRGSADNTENAASNMASNNSISPSPLMNSKEGQQINASRNPAKKPPPLPIHNHALPGNGAETSSSKLKNAVN